MLNTAFKLPPSSIRFMGEDDEKFLGIAKLNAGLLVKHGLTENDQILDLGCGYGRLAFGIEDTLDFQGQYIGLDLLKKHIEWCQNNIQAIDPTYEFRHLDIQNSRYNPKGKILADNLRFDLDSSHFDYVSLFSVFTHMYEGEITNYLQEIFRLLKPGGKCLGTFFLYDDDRMARITDPNHGLCMGHVLNDHTRYHNEQDHLHAICFERDFVEKLVMRLGFKVSSLQYGTWAGGEESYQDYIVLEKPALV